MITNTTGQHPVCDERSLLRIRVDLQAADHELGERIEALTKKRILIRASLGRVNDCLRESEGRAVAAMP